MRNSTTKEAFLIDIDDDDVKDAVRKLCDYEDIGTVSEFRELKEGAQKPIEIKFMGSTVYLCKSCGSAVDNSIIKAEPSRCHCCRTAIDWSEGKE